MDFNKIFKYSWEIFVKDIIPLIVGGFIAGLVGLFTLGIMAGPLYGGLIKMVVRRVRENKTPEIGDIFSAMDQFGTLFITSIVLLILISLGFILCIIPGVLLFTIWMYVFVYIVDKKLSMSDAMSSSKDLVFRVGFGMHIVMVIIFAVISGILGITYIGTFVASPFILVVICVMYFIFNNEEHLLVQKSPSNAFQVGVNNDISKSDMSQKNNYVSPLSAAGPVQTQESNLNNKKVASIVCSNCGNRSTSGAFCVECGAPLKLVCSNCKKELVAQAKFCPSCGSKLD